MSKVFLVIGKSFSGKDTFLSYILESEVFCERNNLYPLVRYTTRSIRPNEVEGVDYHFINDKYYKKNFKDNPKAVVTSFKSEFGHLHYITDFSNLDEDKNYILVGDPESIQPFKEILGDDLCVIFLLPPDWVLFERFSNRDDNAKYSDKKYQEIQRRYVDDLIKFSKANEFLVNVPVIINLGKFVHKLKIKYHMQNFINNDFNSVILNSQGTTRFKNEYGPFIFTRPNYENLNEGIIKICNGGILLNTRDESIIIKDPKYKINPFD